MEKIKIAFRKSYHEFKPGITSMDFPIFDIVLHKMNKLHLLAIQQQVEGG